MYDCNDFKGSTLEVCCISNVRTVGLGQRLLSTLMVLRNVYQALFASPRPALPLQVQTQPWWPC
jgi:hypothetical protein